MRVASHSSLQSSAGFALSLPTLAANSPSDLLEAAALLQVSNTSDCDLSPRHALCSSQSVSWMGRTPVQQIATQNCL